MKRIKVILLILAILLCSCNFCGCSLIKEIGKNANPENNKSTVDGYEVYSVYNRNSDDTYAIIGVDDSKIVNGVWTVPETVGGRAVSGLGYTKSVFMGRDMEFSLKENDNIRKIIVNHEVLLSNEAFVNLTELREIQFNDKVKCYSDYGNISSSPIYSITTTLSMNYYKQLYRQIPDLRCITLNKPDITQSLEFTYPSRIVAYYIHNSTKIVDTFSKYKSLSAFIVEETVTNISQDSFSGSTVDVYVRHTKENCPEGLQNGWDDGVNVIWGFADEIVIFDSLFGSKVTFEVSGRNYVVAKVGEKIAPPAVPTREGYEFTGWYKDYTCMELWNFDTDTVRTSTVLVAGWQAV